MAGGWGSKKNGVRIGVFWDGIELNAAGTQARITNGRVRIDRDVNITDSSNSLSVSGGAVTDASWSNINVSGSGAATIKNVGEQWQTLSYGSTTSANFNASMTGVNYAGGTLTASESVTYPARPYVVPTAPSGATVARTNDATHVVSWSNNPSTAGPYVNVVVEQQTDLDTATWAAKATLSGTTASATVTGTAANHRYRFRVKATNTAGSSTYATTAWIATTPAAPSGVSVTKTGGNAIIKWTNAAPYRTGTVVQVSENGGAWTALATKAAADTSHTHTAPSTASSWKYRVQHVAGALGSAFVETGLLLAVPDAPTGCAVARVSDTQHNVVWSNTNPANANKPYTNVILQRQADSDATAWVTVATLGVVASTSDGSTAANSRYRYRVVAQNSGGQSSASTSDWIATTPAAPTGATAVKAGTAITVSWASSAPYRTGTRVYHAEDGGAFALLTTVGAALNSYTHSDADPAKTHQYRVNHIVGTLESGYSQTAIVQLLTPPAAPTVTVAPNPADVNLSEVTVSWVHQPIDSTAQTAREIRWRTGAEEWTTDDGTEDAAQEISGFLSNGHTYEVQARTKGEHPDWSAWSASKFLVTSATPNVTITSPEPEVETSRVTVAWVCDQTQVAWRVTLYDADLNPLHQRNGTGPATSYAVPTVLVDAATYYLDVAAQNAVGLWSATATTGFETAFMVPPVPEVTAVWNPDTGTAEVLVTNPEPDEGEAEPISQELQRRSASGEWVAVVEDLPISETTSVEDPIPPLNATVDYRVVTWSDLPSSSVVEVSVATPSPWVFLSGGPGWSVRAKLKAGPAVRSVPVVEKKLHRFAGRRAPMEFVGEASYSEYEISGNVAGWAYNAEDFGEWAPWDDIARCPAPVCYRDPIGRRLFVSVDDVPVTHRGDSEWAEVSAKLTEVDHAE